MERHVVDMVRFWAVNHRISVRLLDVIGWLLTKQAAIKMYVSGELGSLSLLDIAS